MVVVGKEAPLAQASKLNLKVSPLDEVRPHVHIFITHLSIHINRYHHFCSLVWYFLTFTKTFQDFKNSGVSQAPMDSRVPPSSVGMLTCSGTMHGTVYGNQDLGGPTGDLYCHISLCISISCFFYRTHVFWQNSTLSPQPRKPQERDWISLFLPAPVVLPAG